MGFTFCTKYSKAACRAFCFDRLIAGLLLSSILGGLALHVSPHHLVLEPKLFGLLLGDFLFYPGLLACLVRLHNA
jgi:hypothetical protein